MAILETKALTRKFGELTAINALTISVARKPGALRALMLQNGASGFGLVTDFSVLFGSAIVLIIIDVRLYPRASYSDDCILEIQPSVNLSLNRFAQNWVLAHVSC